MKAPPHLRFLLVIFFICAAVEVKSEQVTIIDESIPWEENAIGKQPGEVSTWERKVPGADIKQFRGEVVVDHPALHVLLSITNRKDLCQWVFRCIASGEINQDDELIALMRYKGTWPVKPRYVSVASTFWIDGGVIYLQSINKDDTPIDINKKKYIRMAEFNNLFEITPLSGDKTKIRFTTFIDPSGGVPKWLSNMVAKNAPKETLDNLRDRLDESYWDYSSVSIQDLPIDSTELVEEMQNLLSGFN